MTSEIVEIEISKWYEARCKQNRKLLLISICLACPTLTNIRNMKLWFYHWTLYPFYNPWIKVVSDVLNLILITCLYCHPLVMLLIVQKLMLCSRKNINNTGSNKDTRWIEVLCWNYWCNRNWSYVAWSWKTIGTVDWIL